MQSPPYQQQTALHCGVQPPIPHFSSSSSSTRCVPAAPPSAVPAAMSRDVCDGGFRNFSALPPEIRAMVWAFALPEPRVYEVMDVPHARQKMDAAAGLMFANVHHEPPPALAAVCREARGFVLHHYRPLTLGRTTKHVDLARDLLLLEPYLLLKRLHRTLHFMGRIPLIRDHMAGLALGTSYGVYTGICHPVLSWKVAKSNMAKLLTALARFRKLRTLLFVVHQEFQFEFDCRHPPAAVPPPVPPQVPPQAVLPPAPPAAVYATPTASPSTMGLPPSPRVPSSVPGLPPSPPHRADHAYSVNSYSAYDSYDASDAPDAPDAYHPPPYHYPPQAVHQAQAVPAPQPAAPQALRPQVVHQAYRFKFDIEGNINRHPRRPHLNELLFYPLENRSPRAGGGGIGSSSGGGGDDDDRDDWEALLNNSGGGGSAASASSAAAAGAAAAADDDAFDDDGEWCDPWPTNDDWRRFRRRFQRAVVATLQAGLASSGDGQNAFCVDGVVAAEAAAATAAGKESSSSGGGGRTGAAAAAEVTVGDKKYLQFLQQQQRCSSSSSSSSSSSASPGCNGPHHYSSQSGQYSQYSLHGSSHGTSLGHGYGPGRTHAATVPRRRYSLKHSLPAIKGASLLWRYTRGGCRGE